MLCVRSRLDKKNLGGGEGSHHPVIMPKNHYVTKVLVRRFHHQVLHQGCLLTEGAIRTCGFWVVGAGKVGDSLAFHAASYGIVSDGRRWLTYKKIEFSPPQPSLILVLNHGSQHSNEHEEEM